MSINGKKMPPSNSVESQNSEKARVWRVAPLNADASNPNVSRLLKVLSLHKILQTFNGQWRRDRYFDTGESGETYDAEMEAQHPSQSKELRKLKPFLSFL